MRDAPRRLLSRAIEVDQRPPPGLEELDEELSLPHIVVRSYRSLAGKTRIWDSGALKGMTNTEDAIGIEIPGPHTKISTGAGVITSKKWYKEKLPIGDMVHIGLEKTANTVSAGECTARDRNIMDGTGGDTSF